MPFTKAAEEAAHQAAKAAEDALNMNPDEMLQRVAADFAPRPKTTKKRRISIRPEEFDEAFPLTENKVYPKSSDSEVAIERALSAHFLFSRLTDEYKAITVDAMERIELPARDIVVKQGDSGDYFYIIEHGNFSIFIDDVFIAELGDGECFGDLALLYNATRAATVVSTTPSVCFRLGRAEFRNALVNSRVQDPAVVCDFLKDVPLLRGVAPQMLQRITAALQPRRYVPGEIICRQGEPGRCMYFVQRGECIMTKMRAGIDEVPVPRKPIRPGDFFGEGSLLTGQPRVANIVVGDESVTCLLMDKQSFADIIAPLLPDLQLNYVLSILRAVPLFQELGDEELFEIVSVMAERTYASGSYIYTQNDIADAFYIIMHGKVLIKSMVPQEALRFSKEDETERLICEMLVGEFFGEMSLVESNMGKRRRTSAVADGTVRCYVLSRPAFLELIKPVKKIEKMRNEEAARMALRKRFSVKDFTMVRTLGESEFARVRLVRHTGTNRLYACKFWKKHVVVKNKLYKRMMRERDLVYRLRHPFIVEAKGSFMEDNHLVLVYELCAAGTLYGYMQAQGGKLLNETAIWFSANIVLALEYLHAKNIAYRDLRPEVVLIDDKGFLKLSNFSSCAKNYSANSIMFPVCGVPEYIAPEVLLGTGYSRMCDMWQLGILVYEMLVGFTPFNPWEKHGRNAVEIFRNTNKGEFHFPMGSNVHSLSKDLVGRLLQMDPTRRLGADDDPSKGWARLKQHKWFAPVDWDALLRRKISMPYLPLLGSNDIEAANFPVWLEDAGRDYPWHGDNAPFATW